MPFEPLRFIHASNLCLDHQLRDTGPLPGDLHTTLQDATLSAFTRVVSHCIDRQADFLLLTGNTFDEQDQSVRAHAALLAEFDRLDEHGIDVYIAAGELDPLSVWRDLPALPENVILIGEQPRVPVSVVRDGRVIATISVGASNLDVSYGAVTSPGFAPALPQRRGPLAIGVWNEEESLPRGTQHVDADATGASGLAQSLLPQQFIDSGVDYLALAGSGARRTIHLKSGVVHHPGAAQGLQPAHTGPHGCTLVDVDSQAGITCKLLPTAVVRFENFVLQVDERSVREALIDRMRTALRECRPEEHEQVWLNRWTIHGVGPLFELLHDDAARDRLLAVVAETKFTDARVRMVNDLCLLPDADKLLAACTKDRFATEYFELLGDPAAFAFDKLELHLTEAPGLDATWNQRLQSLIAELDPDVVAGHAHRLGMTLFGITPEEGSLHEAYGHSH